MRFVAALVAFVLAFLAVMYLTADLRKSPNEAGLRASTTTTGSGSAQATTTPSASEVRHAERLRLVADLKSEQSRLTATLEEVQSGTKGAKIAANSKLIERFLELERAVQSIDQQLAWLAEKLEKEGSDLESEGHSGYSSLARQMLVTSADHY